jgi:hypothetical protein
VYEGYRNLNVVGESHYQDALWRIVGRRSGRVHDDIVAVLVPETDNPYDANAVSVWIDVQRVGYLPRELAARYRPGLLALMKEAGNPIALRGFIAGGEHEDGPGMLGVFLDHDPVDFGVDDHRAASFDASVPEWLLRLPVDPIAAVRSLRRSLTSESDTITRHQMYETLEQRLYQARDTFASALSDYDAACAAHDLEMLAVREALLARDARLPWLQTYHQMAIRQRKVHEWAHGLRWANRGLALYAELAADPAWVDDLHARAAYFTAKIESEAAIAARRTAREARTTAKLEQPPDMVCVMCKKVFPRPARPGRPPSRCPDCRPHAAS